MAEPKILYLCKYHKDPHCCKHTSRIEDALNFSEVAGGLYVENEIRKNNWIPVKYRPITNKERKEIAEHYGIENCDTIEDKIFDCPMPEDGQRILLSRSWGVDIDVADNDIDGEGFICYGLEGNGDWDGVIAWMPLPEPYKEGEEYEDSQL